MPTTKRRGRPPKPPHLCRTIHLRIPLTPDERRQFDVAARKLGLPTATFVRQNTLALLGPPVEDPYAL